MNVTELKSAEELDLFLKKNTLAVIDFWAEWCGPCRALAPIFKEVSTQISRIAFAKINIEEVRETADTFGIQSIPCLIVFKNGKEADRVLGLQSKESLKAKLENYT